MCEEGKSYEDAKALQIPAVELWVQSFKCPLKRDDCTQTPISEGVDVESSDIILSCSLKHCFILMNSCVLYSRQYSAVKTFSALPTSFRLYLFIKTVGNYNYI